MTNRYGDQDVNERRAAERRAMGIPHPAEKWDIPPQPSRVPTHVVIDTQWGAIIACDATGQAFDHSAAVKWAALANAARKPQFRSYRVYALTEVTP